MHEASDRRRRAGRLSGARRRAGSLLAILAGILCAQGPLARAEEPGGPKPPAPPVRAPRPAPPKRKFTLTKNSAMNVVDESLHGLAEFYLAEDKLEQAVAVLERIAAESPDEETRARTHYNLARMYREKLNDPDRARSEYARVTGPLARGARLTVIGALRREKRWDEIVAFLRECAAASTKPEDKADALTLLVAMIRQSGDKKLIESTLRSVPDLISYKDAELAADVTRKEREKRMRERTERAQKARPPTPSAFSRRRTMPTPLRPTAGRRSIRPPVRRGPGALPTTVRPATDVRVQGAAREKAMAEIRELERAGFGEQARRLRKKLEGKKEEAQPDQF